MHLVGFIVRILRLFANSTRAAIEKIIYIYIYLHVFQGMQLKYKAHKHLMVKADWKGHLGRSELI